MLKLALLAEFGTGGEIRREAVDAQGEFDVDAWPEGAAENSEKREIVGWSKDACDSARDLPPVPPLDPDPV